MWSQESGSSLLALVRLSSVARALPLSRSKTVGDHTPPNCWPSAASTRLSCGRSSITLNFFTELHCHGLDAAGQEEGTPDRIRNPGCHGGLRSPLRRRVSLNGSNERPDRLRSPLRRIA